MWLSLTNCRFWINYCSEVTR